MRELGENVFVYYIVYRAIGKFTVIRYIVYYIVSICVFCFKMKRERESAWRKHKYFLLVLGIKHEFVMLMSPYIFALLPKARADGLM